MDDSLAKMMAQAANRPIAICDEDLRSVVKLANEQTRLEELFAAQQALADETKVELTKLVEVLLPNKLQALGLSSLTLSDGREISIESEVYATISEEKRAAAFAWLTSTGNDGIIKHEYVCPFGKGQTDEVKAFEELLNAAGVSFKSKRFVHPQTLKAFVREQLKSATKGFPLETFSVFEKKQSVVTQPKKKR